MDAFGFDRWEPLAHTVHRPRPRRCDIGNEQQRLDPGLEWNEREFHSKNAGKRGVLCVPHGRGMQENSKQVLELLNFLLFHPEILFSNPRSSITGITGLSFKTVAGRTSYPTMFSRIRIFGEVGVLQRDGWWTIDGLCCYWLVE